MQRTLAAEVKNFVGRKIRVCGWVEHRRAIGGIVFIVLRDRSGIVQIVGSPQMHFMGDALPRTAVSVTGSVRKDDRAPTGVEIVAESIEILARFEPPSAFDDAKLPLKHDIDNRPLTLQSEKSRAILRIRSEVLRIVSEFLRKEDFIAVSTPSFTSFLPVRDDELMEIKTPTLRGVLSPIRQFHKQLLISAGLERVFEIAPVFRAEKIESRRHLSEFVTIEFELAFIEDENEIIAMIYDLLCFIRSRLAQCCSGEFRKLDLEPPKISELVEVRFDQCRGIGGITEDEFPVRADEALFKHFCGADPSRLLILRGLPPSLSPPFSYPCDKNRCRSFRAILDSIAVASGAQRVHIPDLLEKEIIRLGLDPSRLQFYTRAFRWGMPPHGGAAVGVERLLMAICGLDDIRLAIPFPRDRFRTEP